MSQHQNMHMGLWNDGVLVHSQGRRQNFYKNVYMELYEHIYVAQLCVYISTSPAHQALINALYYSNDDTTNNISTCKTGSFD